MIPGDALSLSMTAGTIRAFHAFYALHPLGTLYALRTLDPLHALGTLRPLDALDAFRTLRAFGSLGPVGAAAAPALVAGLEPRHAIGALRAAFVVAGALGFVLHDAAVVAELDSDARAIRAGR